MKNAMTNPNIANTKKTPKPKLTPTERAQAREIEQQAVRARNEAARVEFESHRPARWLTVWAKALRLALIARDVPAFKRDFSWWFESFGVNAELQSFYLNEGGGIRSAVSEKSLTRTSFENVDTALEQTLEWYKEFVAAQEVARLQAVELENRRKAALSKLNEEDRRVLGL